MMKKNCPDGNHLGKAEDLGLVDTLVIDTGLIVIMTMTIMA